jgi:hypothetical protein
MPTTASECAKIRCNSAAGSNEDRASLRRFFGSTCLVQGDQVRDRHGVLRGLSANADDRQGDGLQLCAIRSPSVPAHLIGTAVSTGQPY